MEAGEDTLVAAILAGIGVLVAAIFGDVVGVLYELMTCDIQGVGVDFGANTDNRTNIIRIHCSFLPYILGSLYFVINFNLA